MESSDLLIIGTGMRKPPTSQASGARYANTSPERSHLVVLKRLNTGPVRADHVTGSE